MHRPPLSHGHVALLGDDEDDSDDPMEWTPENDPEQFRYNTLSPEDDDEDGGDELDEGPDDADETEGLPAPPSRTAALPDALNSVMGAVRERFSRVSTTGMIPGLARKGVVFALFVQNDGRVKVLRR